jgi:hypothetical protein
LYSDLDRGGHYGARPSVDRLTANVLAALGLDDLNAAALRALDAYDDTSVTLDNQDAFRVALEAALTATKGQMMDSHEALIDWADVATQMLERAETAEARVAELEAALTKITERSSGHVGESTLLLNSRLRDINYASRHALRDGPR